MSCLAFFKSVKESAKSALQGKLPSENADFEKGYARVIEVRKDLLNIENGVKKWLTSARNLATNAKILARAVNTPARDIDSLFSEMEMLLDDLIVLKSVTKKVGILDDLIRQRYHLRDLRQSKEAYEKKLQQLEEQDRTLTQANPALVKEHDVQKKIIQEKIATATTNYETQLTELTAAIEFFVEEAGTEGGTKLLRPELSAFRSSQLQFFLLCQKLIAGTDVDITDLEAQWKAFARRMSTGVANARSAARKNKDGEDHVMWKEALVTTPPPSSPVQEERPAPPPVPVAPMAPPIPDPTPAPTRREGEEEAPRE